MTILDRSFARLLAISLSIALLAAWLAACGGEVGTQMRVPHAADDAVAAAHRLVFVRLLPAQQTRIDAAYQAALASVPEGTAKAAGIAVGERAAARVLALRADDTLVAETYRPHAVAGIWLPTAPPAAVQWPQRKPWLMTAAVGELLKAEVATGRMPVLATSSLTAKRATRRWTSLDALVREVGNARVWEAVHFRTATEVGDAMGRQIGELAAAQLLHAAP